MRAIKLCVYSSKGGSGKTTCSTNIAGVFAKNGKRVLIIDADPSSNSTQCFDLPMGEMAHTYPELMRSMIPSGVRVPDKEALLGAIVPVFAEESINPYEKPEKRAARKNIFIAPARRGIVEDHTLIDVERMLVDIADQSVGAGENPWDVVAKKQASADNVIWANTYLNDFFSPLEQDFDVIIIDAPGTVAGSMYINSICASDFVVMPVEPNSFDVASIAEMTNIMKMVNGIKKASGGGETRFIGPFVSRFREGNKNSHYHIILEEMLQNDVFFRQRISLRSEVAKAQGLKDLVCFTEPSGVSAGQFRLLTEEIMFRIKLIAQGIREEQEEEHYGEEDE